MRLSASKLFGLARQLLSLKWSRARRCYLSGQIQCAECADMRETRRGLFNSQRAAVKICSVERVLLREAGVDVVDINMGCPSRKVTGGQSGSALMRDMDLAERIIEAALEGAGGTACNAEDAARLG